MNSCSDLRRADGSGGVIYIMIGKRSSVHLYDDLNSALLQFDVYYETGSDLIIFEPILVKKLSKLIR